jgi:hypothetical protein
VLVAAFLLAIFVLLPILSIPFGKDSRILDRPTGWAGAPRPRTG